MANAYGGTNLAVSSGTNIEGFLTNNAGDFILARAATAGVTNGISGYAIGCTLQNATTGSLFINQGTATSATWRDVTY